MCQRSADLRTLVREAVIDITGRLAQKKTDAFSKKIAGLADDITSGFARQREQEMMVSDALTEIPTGVDRIVGQKRFRLACPLAFAGDDGWGPDTDVFTIVSMAHGAEPSHEQVMSFVAANAATFADAVRWLDDAVSDAERRFDAMQWPAPWRRYTAWHSFMRDVQKFIEVVEDATGEEIV